MRIFQPKDHDTRVFENSIGLRLLRYVFGCYLIVTIVVTTAQLLAEYSHVKKGIFVELVGLEQTFKHSIAESVWTFDSIQLSSTLKGMNEIDFVVGVKIVDTRGQILASIGTYDNNADNTHLLSKIPEQNIKHKKTQTNSGSKVLYEYTFPIIHDKNNLSQNQYIGYGHIYSDNDTVMERVKYGFILIIINSVIKTLALWLIFLYFTRNILAVPLRELAERTRDLTPSNVKKETDDNHYGDELECLAITFDNMREAILEKINIIETHNQTLEDRVNQRTADLLKLNEDLSNTLEELKSTQEKLIQSEKLSALGSLVAGISHELNTPVGNGLTAITFLNSATQSIQDKMKKGITKTELDSYLNEMKEGAEIVETSLNRASSLISSFKQLSIDRVTSQRRTFMIDEVIHDIKRAFMPQLREHGIQLDVHLPYPIELDSYPGPLGEVIDSLIQNSIAHGFKEKESGVIKISIHESAGKVFIDFKDDGIGIEEKNIGKVFDPFFTTTLGQGNNGLGLHIIHNIVTGPLGGSIIIESEPGVHTTIHMEFPKKSPREETESAA
ncbi:ATP-binding protein [Teredinibacter sp. KSP-S5-2]|uniref:HAMP domain-containing sensor histidine kinase n=1 Tax=Teredinibacter sp. KSP-S5-2 TaxID=3034506 RepID=UPI002935210A|nr:ATP-binding protein [Teredinibacter sp. KSP-S5-2]WNO10026.1 ATP-binding protein [Teredinibacter sp. KSP-S5-2]